MLHLRSINISESQFQKLMERCLDQNYKELLKGVKMAKRSYNTDLSWTGHP